MALSNSKYPEFENVRQKRNVINVTGTTKTLDSADSGALVSVESSKLRALDL